ncbi:hypothetical protein [Paenibacillus dakarensis]|uniref:hypothetical protein n=1 Tax=Paenibacillus dakarensis TaxID=1527293 RepID=UPI0006D573D6|nr:hypothetical protein [Paenibacillus dakarensis]
MNELIYKERAAKIAMISSIAKSQEALAHILTSIAHISAHSDITARSLFENIRLLSEYQLVMTEMLTGIQVCRSRLGKPAPPWVTSECSICEEDRLYEESRENMV